MRFLLHFRNRYTGVTRRVLVALSEADCRYVAGVRERDGDQWADALARAMATRDAYRDPGAAPPYAQIGDPQPVLLQ